MSAVTVVVQPLNCLAGRDNGNAVYFPQREQVRFVAGDQQRCPSIHCRVHEDIVIWVGTHFYPRPQLDPHGLINQIRGDVRDEGIGDFLNFRMRG
jgi:hypothetical protein